MVLACGGLARWHLPLDSGRRYECRTELVLSKNDPRSYRAILRHQDLKRPVVRHRHHIPRGWSFRLQQSSSWLKWCSTVMFDGTVMAGVLNSARFWTLAPGDQVPLFFTLPRVALAKSMV